MNDRRLVYKVSTTTGEAKSFTFSDLPEESQTYTFFLMSDMLLIFDEVDLRSHKQTRKPQLYANIPIHQLFFFEIENKEHQLGLFIWLIDWLVIIDQKELNRIQNAISIANLFICFYILDSC